MEMHRMSAPVVVLFLSIIALGYCERTYHRDDTGRMLIVLAPPSPYDTYYKDKDLTKFYANYAFAIQEYDDVVLLVDRDSVSKFKEAGIPDHMLLVADIRDTWIRDFSYVKPSSPTSFTYVGGGTEDAAKQTQQSFKNFANKLGLEMKDSKYRVDGGNVVENGFDIAIVTDKFCKDNNLSREQAKEVLKKELSVSRAAVVTADEGKLGHSDGMVMVTGDKTVLVVTYDEPFRSLVLNELKNDLGPDVTIIEVPSYGDKTVYKGGYASSCGVYVNSVVTNKAIYVPRFNHPYDTKARDLIHDNGNGRIAVDVDVTDVCMMGGSLRCLSWQVSGPNAEKIKAAARASKK